MGEKMGEGNDQVQQRQVLVFTIIWNVILTILKVVVGFFSNSKGLIADGVHSASDVLTSVGVLFGVFYAKKPRDQEHPYGHEKIETITAFLMSLVLIGVGIGIALQSVKAIANPEPVKAGLWAFFSAALSIVVKEFQYQITLRVGKKTGSNAMKADAWHHRSDALSSVASLIGLIGAAGGIYVLDAVMGVVVSVIVTKVGWDIFRQSFQELMDVSIDETQLENLRASIQALEAVYHINDLRARVHGSVIFAEVRVCVNPRMDVERGHQVAEMIEGIVREQLDRLEDVIVHLDPCPAPENEKHCNPVCPHRHDSNV